MYIIVVAQQNRVAYCAQIINNIFYYRKFLTKIDVGDNLPVENAINDQCHAFFSLNYWDYKVYKP